MASSYKTMASVTRKSKKSKTKRCSKKEAKTSKTSFFKQMDVVCIRSNTRFLAPHGGNELLMHQVKRQSEIYQKHKNHPQNVKKLSECIVDSLFKTCKSRFIVLTIQGNQFVSSAMTKSQSIDTVQKIFELNINEQLIPLTIDAPSDLKPYVIKQDPQTTEWHRKPAPVTLGPEDKKARPISTVQKIFELNVSENLPPLTSDAPSDLKLCIIKQDPQTTEGHRKPAPVTPGPEDQNARPKSINCPTELRLPEASPASFSKPTHHPSNMSLAEAFGMTFSLAPEVPIIPYDERRPRDGAFEILDDSFVDELAYLDGISDANFEEI